MPVGDQGVPVRGSGGGRVGCESAGGGAALLGVRAWEAGSRRLPALFRALADRRGLRDVQRDRRDGRPAPGPPHRRQADAAGPGYRRTAQATAEGISGRGLEPDPDRRLPGARRDHRPRHRDARDARRDRLHDGDLHARLARRRLAPGATSTRQRPRLAVRAAT